MSPIPLKMPSGATKGTVGLMVCLLAASLSCPASAEMLPTPKKWYRGYDGGTYKVDDCGTPLFLQRSIEYNSPEARELREIQRDGEWYYPPPCYPPPACVGPVPRPCPYRGPYRRHPAAPEERGSPPLRSGERKSVFDNPDFSFERQGPPP